MSLKKDKKYPPYWEDDRSKSQIQITQRLAQKLSEINHQRKKHNFNFTNIDKTLFITVGGVPPMKNQFIELKFPGKVINYRPPFFDRHENDQQNKKPQIKSQTKTEKDNAQKLSKISMDNTCEQISQIICKNGFSEAVFVYHSFGGSIVAWFYDEFPSKVKGLICLGGSPIRFYPIVKEYAKAYLSVPDMSRQFVIQNYEVVYSLYDQRTKNQSKWTRFETKQQLLSFTLHNDPNTLNSLFGKIRNLPLPILMIYGDMDEVITSKLCSQSMIYMCYSRKREDMQTQKIRQFKQRFLDLYKKEDNNQPVIKKDKENTNLSKSLRSLNIQQKLIYFVQGGHSIHVSSKNNKLIQPLIDEYLYMLLGGQQQKQVSQNQNSNKRAQPKL